jgi:hypothetical protein
MEIDSEMAKFAPMELAYGWSGQDHAIAMHLPNFSLPCRMWLDEASHCSRGRFEFRKPMLRRDAMARSYEAPLHNAQITFHDALAVC